MFGTIINTLGGAGGEFEWSGEFPFPASSRSELETYLGLSGGGSHLWQQEDTTPVDVGSLATGNYNFTNSGLAVTTDAEYREGGDIVELNANSDHQSSGSTSISIPASMDGTMSFLAGGIHQVDALNPSGFDPKNIFSLIHAGGNGWDIFCWEQSGAVYLRFRVAQNSYGTQTTVTTAVSVPFSTPFAWFANLDVSGGRMTIQTSVSGSYASVAWSDVGDFDPGGSQPIRHGDSAISGIYGYEGLCAQLFTYEYSGYDAGIDEDTMNLFLQGCDGLL